VVIETSNETLRLGVPSDVWPSADVMVIAMDARRQRAITLSAKQKEYLDQAEEQRIAAEAERRKAKYYTVRRGDAIGSIATMWNTTTDRLRGWNKLPNNNIRIGQTLLVRPAL
jgi:LysM repeat protein